jgi:phage shock protein PspC (stress-responsive transcriptional regulator)
MTMHAESLVRLAAAKTNGGNAMLVHHGIANTALPPALVALLAIVFLVVYVRLLMYFIEDLYRPERRVAGGDKTVWLVIIVFGSVIGILAYILIGREN